jgi:hypothetical protein
LNRDQSADAGAIYAEATAPAKKKYTLDRHKIRSLLIHLVQASCRPYEVEHTCGPPSILETGARYKASSMVHQSCRYTLRALPAMLVLTAPRQGKGSHWSVGRAYGSESSSQSRLRGTGYGANSPIGRTRCSAAPSPS